MSFFEITRHSVLFSRYYYMRNFCNLIGLERWYFSLIWNTYMWKLQTFVGSSISNNSMDAIDCSQSPVFRKIVEIERYALFHMRYGLPSWMTTSSLGLFPSLFFREKPWRRGCLGVKTTNCTSPLLASKNFTRAHLFQIALEIMWLPAKILDTISRFIFLILLYNTFLNPKIFILASFS